MGSFDCACCEAVGMDKKAALALCHVCVLCGCTRYEMHCRECLVDGSRGIYVAQEFAQSCEPEKWGISDADAYQLLQGPENEFYWSTWADINGRVECDRDGKRWLLEQDGDLFARCIGPALKGRMENPKRFWYSLFGANKFACGWCFGDSPEAAREDALKDIRRFSLARGKGTLSLKKDVVPAEYFDFNVEV